MKRSDVEIAESGAGHVAAEVWLEQFNKWVFVDGQWGVIPELRGTPLNAVEFQNALAENPDEVVLRSVNEELDKDRYFDWVYPYLFYFDFNENDRFFGKSDENGNQQGTTRRRKIMLVPGGAAKPKVFQRKTPIKVDLYISNPVTFYPRIPNE